MKCPKCGNQSVLVEGLGEGKVRLSCQLCAYSEVRDSRGKGLLTDTRITCDQSKLLTS
jgi:ribosomal protein S27AE